MKHDIERARNFNPLPRDQRLSRKERHKHSLRRISSFHMMMMNEMKAMPTLFVACPNLNNPTWIENYKRKYVEKLCRQYPSEAHLVMKAADRFLK